MHEPNSLAGMNIYFLEQGMEVLEHITDQQYTFADSPYYSSCTGQHMRHILDHYGCFLRDRTGKIDYDGRDRGSQIEYSRVKAIEAEKELISELERLPISDHVLNRQVLVKNNEGTESLGTPWSSSTVKRELQFLISHTVHHYALIAFILRIQGIVPPKDFGVAPSTLQYQEEPDQGQLY